MDEQEHRGGGGDAGAAILTRQVIAEELGEAEPLEEVVEQRQSGHAERAEGVGPGVGGFAGRSRVVVLVQVCSSIGCWCRAKTMP